MGLPRRRGPEALSYRDLLGTLDAWFARGAARHPGAVPCAAGCSACCHGPFDISAADAELLLEGVAALPPAAQAAVRTRAAALLARMRALAPAWGAPWDVADLGEEGFDRIGEALAAEPCPLLDDEGRCRTYDYRPLVCRLIGLPMATRGGSLLENHCPILHQFPAYAAVPPVEFDLEAFHEAEERHAGAAAGRLGVAQGWETTIAALLGG